MRDVIIYQNHTQKKKIFEEVWVTSFCFFTVIIQRTTSYCYSGVLTSSARGSLYNFTWNSSKRHSNPLPLGTPYIKALWRLPSSSIYLASIIKIFEKMNWFITIETIEIIRVNQLIAFSIILSIQALKKRKLNQLIENLDHSYSV